MIFDFLFESFGTIAFVFFLAVCALLGLALIHCIVSAIRLWWTDKTGEAFDPSWMDRRKWEENQE